MSTTTNRTPRQMLASLLRRKEFAGCDGQVSAHGAGRISIQIFAPATEDNMKRWPYAQANAQATLVVRDFDL